MMQETLEITFAADPYGQMVEYIKRMRVVGRAVKAENPPGRRIESLFLEGRPAVDDAVYAVGFITGQGVPASFGKNRRQLPVDAISALRKRLARPFTQVSVGSSVELV